MSEPSKKVLRAMAADGPERRMFARKLEVRADGDVIRVSGYASVTEIPYSMYGGPPYGWTETVKRGAFTKTIADGADVILNLNHSGLPLARTKSGTLALEEDTTGLRVDTELDASDPDVQRIKPKMERGDLDEMSFAFRVVRQAWNEDYTERDLIELSLDRGDVSIVNFGANPHTSVGLRAAVRSLRELADVEAEEILAEVRDATDDPVVMLSSLRELIDDLLTRARPEATRRMSVAMARRIQQHDKTSVA